MVRILRARFLISLALFLFIALKVDLAFADFKFVVMGDSRGNRDGVNVKVLKELMDEVKKEDVKFIMFVGDMITGSKHNDVHRERLIKWNTFLEEYGIPVYIIVGNHEITSELSEDILTSIFDMPKNGPLDLKGLVYSFDYENAHFVVLDTDVYKNFHRIDDLQIEWLRKDIENIDKEFIFVFGHEPAYPNIPRKKTDSLNRYPSERDNLWQIFKEYGVSIYFSGHEHLYNTSIHEGIYQVVTGGGGAPLYAAPREGGFYHFVLIDVKENGECEITVKDIEGKIRDIFIVKGKDI